MSDRRKTIRYEGWPGGLFSINNKGKATRANLLIADNIVFDEFGAITKRPGISAYGVFLPAEINGLIGPVSVYAGQRYLSLANNTLVQGAPLATIYTYTHGGRGQFLFFDNRYFHTNGQDSPVVWASGDATAAVALGAPLSRICLIHNDRVFVANGTTLYETAPGTGPSSTVDNFATGASWAIQPNDGDPIFGLGSIDRDLYIFKEKSIWLQTGYTVNERQTRIFDNKHGCIAPDSIQTVDLVGAGRAIIFLDSNRKLCAIFDGSVHEISEIVQNELDTIYRGVPADDQFPLNYQKCRCVSAVHPDGYYLLGYATISGASPAQFTNCMVLHTKIPYQSDLGIRWPFAKWHSTGLPDEFNNISFGAMAYLNDLVRKSVAIGQTNNAGDHGLYVMENPPLPYDLVAYNGSGTVTYAIRDMARTIDEDAGDDMKRKNWCEVVAHISANAATATSYTVTQINDSDSTVLTETRILNATTADKDCACAGRLTNDATRCSIQIHLGCVLSEILKLHGLEIKYLPGATV